MPADHGTHRPPRRRHEVLPHEKERLDGADLPRVVGEHQGVVLELVTSALFRLIRERIG